MHAHNLVPVFYTLCGGRSIMAGWQATTTGDIYTVSSDGQRHEIVVGAKAAFKPYQRLRFVRPLDLHPTDYIDADERAHVLEVDYESGMVTLWVEGIHPGLGDGQPILKLRPHSDDEAVECLEHFSDRRWQSLMRRTRRAKGMSGTLLALSTLLVSVPMTIALQYLSPDDTSAFFFVLAVMWSSLVLGAKASIPLALASGFLFGLVSPPFGRLQGFSRLEVALVGIELSVALAFPWMVNKGRKVVNTLADYVRQH